MKHFTVMGRPGCHLCEAVEAGLAELRRRHPFTFASVDVDGDPELAREYGLLVPVVMLGDAEICRYRLDAEALLRALAAP